MNDSSLCIETEFFVTQIITQNSLFDVVVLYSFLVTSYVCVHICSCVYMILCNYYQWRFNTCLCIYSAKHIMMCCNWYI